MTRYVEIAVNVPQARPSAGERAAFHYHLPAELEGQVAPGHLVEVPFGRQRVQGVVLREVAVPAVAETRPVLGLVDPQPVLTPAQLSLAEQLSQACLAPLAACVNLMVPAGLGQLADTLYELAGEAAPTQSSSAGLPGRLLALLRRRGELRGRQIDLALPHQDWGPAARSLVRQGLVTARSVLPPPSVQPKSVRTVQLARPPEVVEAALPEVARSGSQALDRRQALLRFLLGEAGPVDVSWAYAASGGNASDLQALAARGLVTLGESQVWRDPLERLEFVPTDPPQLTHAQQAVWETIRVGLYEAAAGRPPRPYLLHGVTGSGKTEIYLYAVAEAIRQAGQVIVLVPEIALTPQTVRRFAARFPGQVGLAHSGLSPGERYDTWRRARSGELSVVIGPRSALFMPFAALRLIVVDECHDDSYYQDEPWPAYHARQAAVMYARLAGAVCLLGSATPDLDSRYRAEQGQYRYLSLPDRILAHRQAVQAQLERIRAMGGQQGSLARQPSRYHPLEKEAQDRDLPPVTVVDMRQELKAGNRSIFSRGLQAALAQTLADGQQAILFLNRRGTASYVFCRECGHSLKCPRCDLPLTFHRKDAGLDAGVGANPHTAALPSAAPPGRSSFRLICHHCGYTRQMPRTCPQCGSPHIRQFGTGTERVEAEVQAHFPQARTLRWDYETTRQKGAHEIILSHFANQSANVLIGTQMLAKGLDLPLVTLVGVVLADVGLNLPDYRAAERTFQVLTQVAGRAGRSPLGGRVILQTFQPDHYAIQAASRHDYAGFYRAELQQRRQLGYPPLTQMVRLEFRQRQAEQARSAALQMADRLQAWIAQEGRRATRLIGPVPCFFGRVNGLYRWQIVIYGPDPRSLLRDRPLEDARVEVNPVSLL
jgi:primosomal protein N' (replication factor Y)